MLTTQAGFGFPGARVRWLACKPKPDSVLVPLGWSSTLVPHCVLEIALPGHREPYIFDCTIYQYGYDPTKICFVPKSEYKARFVQRLTQFVPISKAAEAKATRKLMDRYWIYIKKRMDKLWRVDLDGRSLSKLSVSDVCQYVLPRAQEAFKGAFQEAYPYIMLG